MNQKQYNTIICATGYIYTTPFLCNELQINMNNNNIYKYIYHSGIQDGTLSFVGIPLYRGLLFSGPCRYAGFWK